MSSEIRYRGVSVHVDTTEPAEFDIKGFQVPDSTLEKIALSLKSVTFSDEDHVFGALRVRYMHGMSVLFTVGRLEREVVITIAGMQPFDHTPSFEELIEKLAPIGAIRGILGV